MQKCQRGAEKINKVSATQHFRITKKKNPTQKKIRFRYEKIKHNLHFIRKRIRKTRVRKKESKRKFKKKSKRYNIEI